MDFKELMEGISKDYLRAGLVGYIAGILNADVSPSYSIKEIKKAMKQYNEMV